MRIVPKTQNLQISKLVRRGGSSNFQIANTDPETPYFTSILNVLAGKPSPFTRLASLKGFQP